MPVVANLLVSFRSVVAKTAQAFGRIDILVNNASYQVIAWAEHACR